MCGNPATTGEHKIKRADLHRIHGRGRQFTHANLNYLLTDGNVVVLQGPNSTYLKYQNVLCAHCNNTKSQPYDRAYDLFIDFVESSREEILTRRQLNFARIFGPFWQEQQLNLYKYFVKAFGCRLADAGELVPKPFSLVLTDKIPHVGPTFCFSVVEHELLKSLTEQKTLRIGNIIHVPNAGVNPRYATCSRYRWLLISYWYAWGPYGPVGQPWFGEQQYLCLGSYTAEDDTIEITRSDGTRVCWPGLEC
jgi:hypothetical protein